MTAPLHLYKADATLSPAQRAQRRRGMAAPLPAFSFPAAPASKESEFLSPLPPRHILNLHPSTTTPPPASLRVHSHRRSKAISTSRTGVRPTSPKHDASSAPPVPEIPSVFKHEYNLSRAQALSRSMSDVSTCPTLESDSGTTSPASFLDFGGPDADDLQAPPSPFQLDPAADASESEATVGADDTTDEDEDDDDEFWHCRGIAEPLIMSRKPSLDEAGGVDVDAWAKAVEQYSYGQIWNEERFENSSPDDFNSIYMDLMRYPLMAPAWI